MKAWFSMPQRQLRHLNNKYGWAPPDQPRGDISTDGQQEDVRRDGTAGSSTSSIVSGCGTHLRKMDRMGTKTGKLHELNLLLRGGTDLSFTTLPDDIECQKRYAS